jgi:hypothetical protein
VAGEAKAGVACASNVWDFLGHLFDKGGIGVIASLLIAYAFYKLVWKVWSAAIKCKDSEIERLINERNYYQSKLFPDRLTSDQRDSE